VGDLGIQGARILAWVAAGFLGGRDREGRSSFGLRWILIMVFEVVFSVLGAFVVSRFSRRREFRADAGSVELLGREPMLGALRALQRTTAYVGPRQPALNNFKTDSWVVVSASDADGESSAGRASSGVERKSVGTWEACPLGP